MSCFDGSELCKEKYNQEILEFESTKRLVAKLKKLVDDHTLRYAHVDLLYWYEFQNWCSDILAGYLDYLKSIDWDQDKIKDVSDDEQRQFCAHLETFKTMAQTIFDIVNSEKCASLSYFALCDDLYAVITQLMIMKILGVEQAISTVIETFDCYMAYKQSVKCRYKDPNSIMIWQFYQKFIDKFVEIARGMALMVTSKANEEQVRQQKIEAAKKHNFIEVKGLDYSIYKSYELINVVVMISLNPVIVGDPFDLPARMEQVLPPKYTVELLIQIL